MQHHTGRCLSCVIFPIFDRLRNMRHCQSPRENELCQKSLPMVVLRFRLQILPKFVIIQQGLCQHCKLTGSQDFESPTLGVWLHNRLKNDDLVNPFKF